MERVYVIRKINYHIIRRHDAVIKDYDQLIDLLRRLDDESREAVYKNFFDAVETVKEIASHIVYVYICHRVEENSLSDDDWSMMFNAKDKTGVMTVNYHTNDFDLTLTFTIKETNVIVYDD